MKHDEFFYNCSEEYLNSMDPSLYGEIAEIITKLFKRQKQDEINNDLFWLLTNKGWSYDTLASISDLPPRDFRTVCPGSDIR